MRPEIGRYSDAETSSSTVESLLQSIFPGQRNLIDALRGVVQGIDVNNELVKNRFHDPEERDEIKHVIRALNKARETAAAAKLSAFMEMTETEMETLGFYGE